MLVLIASPIHNVAKHFLLCFFSPDNFSLQLLWPALVKNICLNFQTFAQIVPSYYMKCIHKTWKKMATHFSLTLFLTNLCWVTSFSYVNRFLAETVGHFEIQEASLWQYERFINRIFIRVCKICRIFVGQNKERKYFFCQMATLNLAFFYVITTLDYQIAVGLRLFIILTFSQGYALIR